MLTELARPLSYLTIRHPDNTVHLINWVIPIVAGLLYAVVWHFTRLNIDTFGSAGLLSKIVSFVQSLPGFYLAALAAVATFNNAHLDKLMPGDAPQAKVLYHGKLTLVSLTRRRMLSLMFSYLVALSFVVTLLAIFATSFAAPLKPKLGADALHAWKIGFMGVYVTLFTQMLCVTLWGLFYLGERVHTPD